MPSSPASPGTLVGQLDTHLCSATDAEALGGRLRLLRHPGGVGRGTGPSRNLGLEAARGRYIAFLDADDVYEPRRLERHVQYLDRDSALGVVLSAELYWRSWRPDGRGQDRVIGPAVTAGRRIEPPALILATLLTRGAPLPSPCSLTFRADALARVGAIPEEFTGHYEDQALICKLLLEYRAVVLADCLARYRQHTSSLTQANAPLERRRGSEAWVSRRRFLEWLGPYARSRGLRLAELENWIRDELAILESVAAGGGQLAAARTNGLTDVVARALPTAATSWLGQVRHAFHMRRMRRRVMHKVEQLEHSGPVLERSIRAYWNARIHDTKLSNDVPSTAGFYAALDEYRVRKNPYLTRLVDFTAWSGRDVLEIGCGAGLDLVRFARGGARVTGVDVAEAAIDLARQAAAAAGIRATLVEADGARLPFPDASFDLVYCHGVLSFARDASAIIAEAHRVLRPGGQAILMVYNRRSWMQWLLRVPGRLVAQGHADAPAFRTYARREFEALLGAFPRKRVAVERPPPLPGFLRPLGGRWLRPMGWHLIAFCQKPA